MNPRQLVLVAAGVGTMGLVACGAQTVNFENAAATSHPAATAGPVGAVAQRCDDGRWTGAVSPEGRPDGFDAGDQGAVYIWHDRDGWHIRATDRRPTDHHYTGTVALSRDGSFTALRPVRDERDDRVFVDGDNVLHYDFHTFSSIDGADFRVTCGSEHGQEPERQRLTFHTEFDGRPIADRVRIGDSKQSPRTATFSFVRSA